MEHSKSTKHARLYSEADVERGGTFDFWSRFLMISTMTGGAEELGFSLFLCVEPHQCEGPFRWEQRGRAALSWSLLMFLEVFLLGLGRFTRRSGFFILTFEVHCQ